MIVPSDIRFTRNLFLRCVSVIYLFAFSSLYIQIPGLYGDNGILPAKTQLESTESDWRAQVQKKPTLLWFAPYLGLTTEYMMDILALAGIFLAFSGFISTKFCVKPTFAGLWSLYYSLYQVGQTFMWFQWDILVLETGLLCVLLSPLWQSSVSSSSKSTSSKGNKQSSAASQSSLVIPSKAITLWLVKWLLVRLLFSSGVVKLTSGCPLWWGLTALKVHFESMCLPSPLAWYSHHLPAWLLKITTVFAISADVLLPILFFAPVRLVRITACFIQVFLQVAIILTGNFNFFNYLTIVLCLSLLDDSFFNRGRKESSSTLKKVGRVIITIAVYVALIALVVHYFGIKFDSKGVLDAKIMFNNKDLDKWLSKGVPLISIMAAGSLALTSFQALSDVMSVQTHSNIVALIGSILTTMGYAVIAAAIFADSLVPFSSLTPKGNVTVPNSVKEWHASLSHLHITNSYGMLRRMTGVSGRPEVIIEASNSKEGPWSEYSFKYKPGAVDVSLPWVAPHQPRLDWHMWFAALGTYHQNPWIMSLTYRLLKGEPPVLHLLGPQPKTGPPLKPKFIRASLYNYRYTPASMKNSNSTWTRHKVSEYFPIFSVDHPPLLEYLEKLNILAKGAPKRKEPTMSPQIKQALDMVRDSLAAVEPPILMLSLFVTGLAFILANWLLAPSPKHHPQQQKKSSQKQK